MAARAASTRREQQSLARGITTGPEKRPEPGVVAGRPSRRTLSFGYADPCGLRLIVWRRGGMLVDPTHPAGSSHLQPANHLFRIGKVLVEQEQLHLSGGKLLLRCEKNRAQSLIVRKGIRRGGSTAWLPGVEAATPSPWRERTGSRAGAGKTPDPSMSTTSMRR